MNRASLLVSGLLAVGLFLGGTANVVLEASKVKRPEQSTLSRFRVVYFVDEKPALGTVGQIPKGATFYLGPSEVTSVVEELSRGLKVALDIDNHSKSKSEEEIYLEITDGSTIERFYYFAGAHEIAPLGYSRVDGETLLTAMGAGLKLSLVGLVFGGLLCWASARESGQKKTAHGSQQSPTGSSACSGRDNG
ncbi:MAG: hypothetical protein KC800_31750, partial [Candidatus Eremiobacteraeota bacterium]|nr:hypothetical protein [Candidatus Eremiobacteraeota bacterium]